MDKVKLTIYDWISYLFPGAIILWGIVNGIFPLIQLISNQFVFNEINFVSGSIIFIISYVLGHILHIIANFTIDLLPFGTYPPKNYLIADKYKNDFTNDQIELLKKCIKKKYGYESGNDYEIIRKSYWLCFDLVTLNKPESLSNQFLSQNGLYRGLTMAFSINSIIFFINYLLSSNQLWILSSIFLILSMLCVYRTMRFKHYLTKTVYTEFINLIMTD